MRHEWRSAVREIAFKTKRSAGEPAASMVLTVEEVARYLHVHQSTIYRLVRQKELPGFQVGSDYDSTSNRSINGDAAWPRTPAKKSSRDRCNVVRRGKDPGALGRAGSRTWAAFAPVEERFDRPRTRNSGSPAEVSPRSPLGRRACFEVS